MKKDKKQTRDLEGKPEYGFPLSSLIIGIGIASLFISGCSNCCKNPCDKPLDRNCCPQPRYCGNQPFDYCTPGYYMYFDAS